MKRILSVCVLLICGYGVFAQAENAKGNGKISGAVIDAETNQPVEFANVALLDPTTQKPLDGAVCDDKGKFVIPKVAPGKYSVAISFIGYETQTIESITVEDKKDDVNLGLIKLATAAASVGVGRVSRRRCRVNRRSMVFHTRRSVSTRMR